MFIQRNDRRRLILIRKSEYTGVVDVKILNKKVKDHKFWGDILFVVKTEHAISQKVTEY